MEKLDVDVDAEDLLGGWVDTMMAQGDLRLSDYAFLREELVGSSSWVDNFALPFIRFIFSSKKRIRLARR